VLPLLILFLITIIYSRKLSLDEYGKFQSVWMYANIVNVIISFGFSSVILSSSLNFLFDFIKKNKKKIVFFYSILWITGFSAFYLFAKNFSDSLKLLLIAFMIIQNVSTITETFLIKRQGEKISFAINFIYSLLFFGWHIYVLQTNYSLFYLIAGIAILSVLKWMVMLLIPAKTGLFAKPTTSEKQFLNHWIYLGSNDILGIVSKWIDKIFLLYMLTTADFAIFFNGSFEIPLFGLFISVLGSFLLIEISRNTQGTSKIIKLYRESFNMLSSIVFPLFFFLFFFRHELFSIIFKDKYNASLPIFVISIFIIPLRINNYSVILLCFSKGKKILLGSLLDIAVAILLMLALYPIMGTRGIALAIVIGTFCQVAFYLWHSARTLSTSVFQIIPLKKLFFKFVALLALYFILFFAVSEIQLKIKLAVAVIFTTLIIVAGIIKYIKPLLKKENI
jgi:O-antigen/teichoic acid export membrane protein